MTELQALRQERRECERRRQREIERCKQVKETLNAVLFIMCMLVAYSIVGTMDYEDEQRNLAYWESQGIHIVRDW